MDKETKKIQDKGTALKDLIASSGWKDHAEPALKVKIQDLQNINNLEATTDAEVLVEIKVRKLTADALYEWLKSDIYGEAEQHEDNNGLMVDHIDRD